MLTALVTHGRPFSLKLFSFSVLSADSSNSDDFSSSVSDDFPGTSRKENFDADTGEESEETEDQPEEQYYNYRNIKQVLHRGVDEEVDRDMEDEQYLPPLGIINSKCLHSVLSKHSTRNITSIVMVPSVLLLMLKTSQSR